MEKRIIRSFIGFIALVSFVFVFSGCQKEHNLSLNHHSGTHDGLLKRHKKPDFSFCTGAIPAQIQVPAGNKLLMTTYAKGYQIYQVKRNPNNHEDFEWVFVAPSAKLYALPNFVNLVAEHYGGPTWEFLKRPFKDQKVVAAKVSDVVPDNSAIPWLLLKTNDDKSTPGNRITYIQRLCTTGGLKPGTGAVEENQDKLDSIPYTAVYKFFVRE